MGVIYGLKTDLYLGAPILYGVGKKIINQLICFRKSQPGLVQAVLLGGDWNHGILNDFPRKYWERHVIPSDSSRDILFERFKGFL